MSESMELFFIYTGMILLIGIIIGYYLENLYQRMKAYRVRKKFKKKAKAMKGG